MGNCFRWNQFIDPYVPDGKKISDSPENLHKCALPWELSQLVFHWNWERVEQKKLAMQKKPVTTIQRDKERKTAYNTLIIFISQAQREKPVPFVGKIKLKV